MYAFLRIPAVSLARSILQADFKGRVIHLMAQQPTSLSTCLVLWMRIRSDHVTSMASSYTRRIRCWTLVLRRARIGNLATSNRPSAT